LKNSDQISSDSTSLVPSSKTDDATKAFYSLSYENKQIARLNTDHLKTQQAAKKTTIKRNYNLNDEDFSNNSIDTNNNVDNVSNANFTNTDDSSTLSDNSIVLNLDVTSNKLRINKQQREMSIDE
jgi:hypothetical protein